MYWDSADAQFMISHERFTSRIKVMMVAQSLSHCATHVTEAVQRAEKRPRSPRYWPLRYF